MMRTEIQEVLEVCAARLESRAVEFEERGYTDNDQALDDIMVASILRSEAKIIRAGCHVYPEIPAPLTEVERLRADVKELQGMLAESAAVLKTAIDAIESFKRERAKP